MRRYPEAREILVTAVRELDMEVWKWGARAIMTWEFEGALPCPVHQIHGDEDAITPVYRVTPEVVVHGGGHMVNLTHPGEVNAFIAQRLARETHF
jgi:pimeloyl-ACP methyl ester carboxylesterase